MSRKRSSDGPRLLVTDRNSCVLLERARLHVDGERVVYHAADPSMIRRFNLPFANVALVLLGQGTSITQEAAQRLAGEGVMVAFSGSGGTPLLMGSLVSYKATAHFRRMARVYDSEPACLEAAKEIMRIRIERMLKEVRGGTDRSLADACLRFSERLEAAPNHPTLMAHEAEFARAVYGAFCRAEGVRDFVRTPGEDGSDGRAGFMNRMIDHGNYLAYGIAGAAVWALGVPVHMSVMHGRTRPGGLVFDVADTWKDSVVIPAAAKHSKKDDEKEFRAAIINRIDDESILSFSVSAVNRMIEAGERVIGPMAKDARYAADE